MSGHQTLTKTPSDIFGRVLSHFRLDLDPEIRCLVISSPNTETSKWPDTHIWSKACLVISFHRADLFVVSLFVFGASDSCTALESEDRRVHLHFVFIRVRFGCRQHLFICLPPMSTSVVTGHSAQWHLCHQYSTDFKILRSTGVAPKSSRLAVLFCNTKNKRVPRVLSVACQQRPVSGFYHAS